MDLLLRQGVSRCIRARSVVHTPAFQMFRHTLAATALAVVLTQSSALTRADETGVALYVQQIKPALEKHCAMCHDGQSRKGGLDVTSREALLRGGTNGPAILPGNAKDSLLHKLIAHEQEPRMPYKTGKLPDEVIAKFGEWINAGAPYGESAAAPTTAGSNQGGNALFATYIRPLLETQCLNCHGAGQVKRSGFDLSTRDGLLRGGDIGPAVIPGNARESALYKRVSHEVQPGMPFQAARLSEEQVARIREWIDAGAPYDGPLSAKAARRISSHWAFQAPKKYPVPQVKNVAFDRKTFAAYL